MNVCSKCGVFVLSLEHEAKFSDMDKVQKQRGSIVLHKETRDGADYIRIEYANSQAVAQLLAQDTGIEMAGNGSAYIASAAFSLPDFYDRYSPHAYIDYSRIYVRHPKPKREYTLPKGYLELLEQKRYSPSTVKTYRAWKSACSLSSFREHSMRAGKARVWQVHLAVRLCGFPTALFTKYSQPCHARLAFRGMCQWKRI